MDTPDPLDRIIWSADVPDVTTLMGYIDQMPQLRMVKIDRLFVTESGLGIIDKLNNRGLHVFDDAKIVEIPSKAESIARKHLAHHPWMLNCMAGILSSGIVESGKVDEIDGLKRFADACLAADSRPCAVTVLTSKTKQVVGEESNGRWVAEQVLYYVEILLNCGFTDIVCSPKEVPLIRHESRFDSLDLNTPGIRLAGSDTGDQARVDTPAAALAAGATRLVIGRPITEGNPAKNLADIVASINSAA